MFSIVMRVSVQRSRTLCCIYRKFPFRILPHQPDLFVSNNGKFRWRYCSLLSPATIIVTFKSFYCSGGGNRKIDYLSLLPCPFTWINILLYQFACLFLVSKCFLRPKVSVHKVSFPGRTLSPWSHCCCYRRRSVFMRILCVLTFVFGFTFPTDTHTLHNWNSVGPTVFVY